MKELDPKKQMTCKSKSKNRSVLHCSKQLRNIGSRSKVEHERTSVCASERGEGRIRETRKKMKERDAEIGELYLYIGSKVTSDSFFLYLTFGFGRTGSYLVAMWTFTSQSELANSACI